MAHALRSGREGAPPGLPHQHHHHRTAATPHPPTPPHRTAPPLGRSLSREPASGSHHDPAAAYRGPPQPRSPCWPLPGAIVATLTELIEPFGLNDNVTIPVFSSIALQFGFSRISSCHIGQGQGVALLKEIFSNLNLWSQSTGMAPVDGPP